jgi:hypothetical protein
LGEKDITEKTLVSYNDVFSDIVNGLLFEGRPVVKPDALSDAAPYSMYKADGKIEIRSRKSGLLFLGLNIRPGTTKICPCV